MLKKLSLLTLIFFVLAGCAPLERGISETFSDSNIKGQIEYLWFETKKDFYKNLNITVDQRRVLIVGNVESPQDHIEAIDLAWKADGVLEIIDEIKVGEYSWGSYTQDAWISLQIRNAFIFEKGLSSTKFTVFTVEGIVYLLGVASDQRELDKALTLARTIKGVKAVKSYIRLKNEING